MKHLYLFSMFAAFGALLIAIVLLSPTSFVAASATPSSAPTATPKAATASTAPPAVQAIDLDDTRYIFNQPTAGEVTAWKISTGKMLWQKTLYTTSSSTPVYINKAELKGSTITVTSQAGGNYKISTTDPTRPDISGQTNPNYYAIVAVVVLAAIAVFFGLRKKRLAVAK